jgi:hypothetical protein
MNTMEVGKKLVSLCQQHKDAEALTTLFDKGLSPSTRPEERRFRGAPSTPMVDSRTEGPVLKALGQGEVFSAKCHPRMGQSSAFRLACAPVVVTGARNLA